MNLSPAQLEHLRGHAHEPRPFIARGYTATTRILIDRGFLRFERGGRVTRITPKGRCILDIFQSESVA